MAFHQADGSVAWAGDDFGNVYSSPLLINVWRVSNSSRC